MGRAGEGRAGAGWGEMGCDEMRWDWLGWGGEGGEGLGWGAIGKAKAKTKTKTKAIFFIFARLFFFVLWSNARLTRLPPTDNLSPTDQHAHVPWACPTSMRSGRVRGKRRTWHE